MRMILPPLKERRVVDRFLSFFFMSTSLRISKKPYLRFAASTT